MRRDDVPTLSQPTVPPPRHPYDLLSSLTERNLYTKGLRLLLVLMDLLCPSHNGNIFFFYDKDLEEYGYRRLGPGVTTVPRFHSKFGYNQAESLRCESTTYVWYSSVVGKGS